MYSLLSEPQDTDWGGRALRPPSISLEEAPTPAGVDCEGSSGDSRGSNSDGLTRPLVMVVGTAMESSSLKVRISDSSFVVAKPLVAKNCEYFRALFDSGMMESRQEEVHLQCVGVQGFLAMLQVLDGGRPVLDGDQIVEAIACAAFLQVPALARHLANSVNSENCLLMYHTAATYGVWELARSSASFIRDMYADLKEDVDALPSSLADHVRSLPPSSYVAVCSHSPATDQSLEDPQRTVRYLDEDQQDWKVLTHLPASASTTMAGVAVLDNQLYVVGGVHDVSKKVVDAGYRYDPLADAWSPVRGPLQPRYNLTLVGHDGCLYAIGGEFQFRATPSVERYRAEDGTWTLVSPLPRPAASVASATAAGRIFVCLWGGNGATDIYEYQPREDRWLPLTTLVRPHSYGLYMVAHRDDLYVMRNGPCEDFLMCVMDRYSLSSGQWTSVAGQYGNTKGSLFTAAVRGDSVFTLSRHVTTEYAVGQDGAWRQRRKMKGFGRIGSIHTFLMRLPNASVSGGGKVPEQTEDRILKEPGECPPTYLQCRDHL